MGSISLSVSELQEILKDELIFLDQKNNKQVEFTTEDIISFNNRITENQQKILMHSEAIILEILENIQDLTDCLFALNSYVSQLDMLTSFAVSTTNSFTRPKFETSGED